MTQPDPTTAAPAPPDPAGATPAPVAPTPAPADPWETSQGKGGKAAVLADLATVREENRLLAAKLAPLEPILAALGTPAPGKTDIELLTERFAAQETTLAEERSARIRAEVAHEKGLTPKQASRLVGATREELLADADDLVATFPTPPAGKGTPPPDPSQGGSGGGNQAASLDAQIATAQAAGDWRTVLSLQNTKLANLATKST